MSRFSNAFRWGLAVGLTVAAAAAQAVDAQPDLMQEGLAAYWQGDYDQAISKLEKPAGEGSKDALFYLGEAVYFNSGRPGHWAQAYNVYKLGAQGGDKRAQFRLAEMMVMGIPTKRDVNGAFAMLRKSAEAGYVPAAEELKQALRARAMVRDTMDRFDTSTLVPTQVPEAENVEAVQFGVGPQAVCTDPKEAALLAKVGNTLYDAMQEQLLTYHYNTINDDLVVRPSLVALYAHVIESEKTAFKSCSITLGLPADATTTAMRIMDYDLVEFKTPKAKDGNFWLAPNRTDSIGFRLGASMGPKFYGNGTYGCDKDGAAQVVLKGAKPDAIKSCEPMKFGMVAATGRELKISHTDDRGMVQTQLLPEMAVFGQFKKLYYLVQ